MLVLLGLLIRERLAPLETLHRPPPSPQQLVLWT